MWGVHFLSKRMSEQEYANFGTLMAIIMNIPGVPLQMVFTRETAAALATKRVGQLAGMVRQAWLAMLAVCLLAAVGLWFGQSNLVSLWKLASPTALWITLLAALFALWSPMFNGLMQGEQDFLWLGWANTLNGVGRLGIGAALVFALGGHATVMLLGVGLGYAFCAGVGIWQTTDLWAQPAEPYDWRALWRTVLPLFLGFGAVQFIFTGDILFVNHYLPSQGAFYNAAGTLSRALVWLVGPLTGVMFPKIVHSAAKSEKTDWLGLTLVCSAALAIMGAAGLWLLGSWVVRFVYPPEYVPVATAVLPWYAGAMLPLCLANVLVNNLLAQSRFRIVPVLVVLAILYGVALTIIHSSLIAVLQTLGVFNLAVFGVCAFFTWPPKAFRNNRQTS